MLAPSSVSAHDEFAADGAIRQGWKERHVKQHGTAAGHLPEVQQNVDLVSKLVLKNVVPEKVADVGISPDGNYAFVAAWGVSTCKYNGVHVVNIANPAAPREVAFIASKEGSYPGEGVHSLKLTTPAFSGDILVTNNEKCKDRAGFGGINIYDVTNPARPTPLAEGVGDFTVNGQGKKAANETHSVFAWDAGEKAYAVMVDNEEGRDVDIVDITDPKRARLIAEYDLNERFPQIRQAAPPNLTEVFLHDMTVKNIGGRHVMLLSYWDGGYVKIDVDDPANPIYRGDSDFADPDPEALQSGFTVPSEGNAHQAEFTSDNAYVVGADEDFAPYQVVGRNATDGTVINASQGSHARRLREGETISGPSVFVGRACNGDPAVPSGAPGTQIAVVERGVCFFNEKVANVLKAGGYEAVLVFNRTAPDGCSTPLSMNVEGDIPTFGVAPRTQGFAIFNVAYDHAACLAGDGNQLAPIPVGSVGDALSFSSYFDGWGYVRLYRNKNGKLTELDTYALPEAHNPAFASGFGDLSVHEVATSNQDSSLLYVSYYSGGLRVARIANDRIVEVGSYIAPGGSNLWGVEVFQDAGQEYVAASDRDSGLLIFRYRQP
ncbi:MAG TPA: PA domain-containing protein [Acidimicrobiales bacterium]|nr:PA domain-containing protein [Acidimicrobiales bacterium]